MLTLSKEQAKGGSACLTLTTAPSVRYQHQLHITVGGTWTQRGEMICSKSQSLLSFNTTVCGPKAQVYNHEVASS